MTETCGRQRRLGMRVKRAAMPCPKWIGLVCILLAVLLAAGCGSDEDPVLPSIGTQVTEPVTPGAVKGFFVLNEGNMGSNKASLDYFDYATGTYYRNIFPERNPDVAHAMGDVGNDLQIHDGRLYAVINKSNLVRVMDLATARLAGTFTVPNCRYIAFHEGFAYVSSFAGPAADDGTQAGTVAKVDLATLEVVDHCTVGRQPEEMAIVDGKLYVANSGGYTPNNYDTTVSVVDLATFRETGKIEMAINLHRMEADPQGNIWVTSRGDYYGSGSKLFVIDTRIDEVAAALDLSVSNMTLHGGLLYAYSAEWNATAGKNTISYAVVDTRTRTVTDRNFIKDGTEKDLETPYGIAVNPETGEILVADSRRHLSHGTLHCYSPDGIRKWSVTTGDIPAHIAFTTKKLQ